MTTSGSIRASDADRELVVEILREQTAQGRLTLEELSGRTDAAYTATTWQQLTTLTRDLPVEVRFERDEHGRPGQRPRSSQPSAGLVGRASQGDRFTVAAPAWRMLLGCCWLEVGSPHPRER
jgi:hypothetical protein